MIYMTFLGGVLGLLPVLFLFQGAAKGVRQKEFDHFFSFSGRFQSLFGHFF